METKPKPEPVDLKALFTKLQEATQEKFKCDANTANTQLALEYMNMAACGLIPINRAKAKKYFETSLQINPNHGFLLANYAHLLNMNGDYFEAKRMILRAIEQLEQPAFLLNLGTISANLEDYKGAINAYRKGLSILVNPKENNIEAVLRHNLAMSYFALGHWSNGWTEYEYRHDADSKVNLFCERFKDLPKLESLDNIKDKTIYFYNEQGIGDLIMFSRYLNLFKELGAKVILEAQSEIAIFMEPFVDVQPRTKTWRNDPKDIDFVASINSVPKFWDENINGPNDIPFTPPPLDINNAWKLPEETEKGSIGICWQGNLDHSSDLKRSCSVELFKRFKNKGKLYNLSKFEPPDWIETTELNDYIDTMRLINKMEVVISVDTSVVHMAASMGKPTLLICAKPPDWRWHSSRWYGDNLVINKQKESGQWGEAFDMAEKKLEEIIK